MSSWLASLWPAHAAAAPPAPVLPPSSFLPDDDVAAASASTPSDAASQPAAPPGARSPSSASSQASASRHAGPNLPIDAVYIPPDEMLGRPAVLQHLPYSKSLRDPAAFIKPEMAPGAKAPPSREPTPQERQEEEKKMSRPPAPADPSGPSPNYPAFDPEVHRLRPPSSSSPPPSSENAPGNPPPASSTYAPPFDSIATTTRPGRTPDAGVASYLPDPVKPADSTIPTETQYDDEGKAIIEPYDFKEAALVQQRAYANNQAYINCADHIEAFWKCMRTWNSATGLCMFLWSEREMCQKIQNELLLELNYGDPANTLQQDLFIARKADLQGQELLKLELGQENRATGLSVAKLAAYEKEMRAKGLWDTPLERPWWWNDKEQQRRREEAGVVPPPEA